MAETATPIAPLELARLARAARELAGCASPGELPAGDERRWVQLLATDEYDAWLIAWPPGAALGLHDHGGSSGAVHVVVGELEERRLDGGRPERVQVRTIAAGDAVAFGPDHIHSVVNGSAAEAISLHVYSPPLRQMTYWAGPWEQR